MDRIICPICGEGELQPTAKLKELDFEGHQITYRAQHSTCTACNAHIVTSAQLKSNKRAIIAAKSAALDLPSKDALRKWRKRWGLTQRTAGDLLGVGPVAFSKYENSALLPSAPTGRLLDAVMSSDKVVRKLAEKHSIAVQLGKDSTSRPVVLSVKQITDSLVTIINASLPSSDVTITGHSAIAGVFKTLSSLKDTSLNIRQTKPEIYHEWTPSLPGQIMNSYFAEHGEDNVSYH